MAIRRPVVSVPEGGNPTLGLEQMPTGDTIDPAVVPAVVHDATGPTGTGPEFEHYNAAERAAVDGHVVDAGNPHGVTAAQAGAAPIAHVGAGGVAEHALFTVGLDGFVPDPVSSTGLFLRDDGVWATPTGTAFALVWRFETSIVMAAPANTRFRMNNATPASVTALAVDDQTRDGVDASTLLDNLTAGDAIIIQQVNDATKYVVLDVVLSTDNAGWFEITVTVADSGVLFDNNQDCVFIITKAGGGGGGAAFIEKTFEADQLENPNNADWAVNSLAPAVADTNNNGLTVRLFDDTTEEGVGFKVRIPATAANVIFRFFGRAETTDAGVRTVGLEIYEREIPDNAAVTAWSAGLQLDDVDIPVNEFFQYDEQTLTLAALGVTAGSWHQFELTRVAPSGGTDLVGDYALLAVKVDFS